MPETCDYCGTPECVCEKPTVLSIRQELREALPALLNARSDLQVIFQEVDGSHQSAIREIYYEIGKAVTVIRGIIA